jgi:hypothetical protein
MQTTYLIQLFTIRAADEEDNVRTQRVRPVEAANVVGQPFHERIVGQELVLTDELEHPLQGKRHELETNTRPYRE